MCTHKLPASPIANHLNVQTIDNGAGEKHSAARGLIGKVEKPGSNAEKGSAVIVKAGYTATLFGLRNTFG